MANLTPEERARADAVLCGEQEHVGLDFDYDDVVAYFGLDTSFLYTADTFSAYVETYRTLPASAR